MRTLRFIVKNQIIEPDPNCDFSNIVPGTEGYLRVEFEFSSDWRGCTKVAQFWSGGKECEPKALKEGRYCMVPADASVNRSFDIRVYGRRGALKLVTNEVTVIQDGGKS